MSNDIEYCIKEVLRTRGPQGHSELVGAASRLSWAPPQRVVYTIERMQLSRALQYDPPTRRYSLT